MDKKKPDLAYVPVIPTLGWMGDVGQFFDLADNRYKVHLTILTLVSKPLRGKIQTEYGGIDDEIRSYG